jgi:hypothetical protein
LPCLAHHLAYLARKAVSSVATIHEPISKLILRMYRPVTNRAQKDDDNDLQIGVAVGAVHRMIHGVLFRRTAIGPPVSDQSDQQPQLPADHS